MHSFIHASFLSFANQSLAPLHSSGSHLKSNARVLKSRYVTMLTRLAACSGFCTGRAWLCRTFVHIRLLAATFSGQCTNATFVAVCAGGRKQKAPRACVESSVASTSCQRLLVCVYLNVFTHTHWCFILRILHNQS